MCYCLKLVCMGCYGCGYSVAYLVSPSFRRREDEKRCQKNEMVDELIRNLDETLSKFKEHADVKQAKLLALIENDLELNRRVQKAVSVGVPLYDAIETCSETMNTSKLSKMIDEEVEDGMPYRFAVKIAKKKLKLQTV